jgi:hypothetical protein
MLAVHVKAAVVEVVTLHTITGGTGGNPPDKSARKILALLFARYDIKLPLIDESNVLAIAVVY